MTPSYLLRNANKRLRENGLTLLDSVPRETISACFFDPQYRMVMEKMKYGNEGARQKERAKLPQMGEDMIIQFLTGITKCLKPGGYCFFWVDKFMLAEGLHKEIVSKVNLNLAMNYLATPLYRVDVLTWHKERIGQGYRTRRASEFLVILQKFPKSTKTWVDHGIPDVWTESIPHPKSHHTHTKPIGLTRRLIECVTEPMDYILDPCAGEFTTLEAAKPIGRNFIGCDITPKYGLECPHGRKSPGKCPKCAKTQVELTHLGLTT